MKNKVKTFVPPFSKYRIINKNNKYSVEVPCCYFFWKPLKIKIVGSVLDFEVPVEFDTKSELNEFIKYRIFNYKNKE